jgi:hypothetical protein
MRPSGLIVAAKGGRHGYRDSAGRKFTAEERAVVSIDGERYQMRSFRGRSFNVGFLAMGVIGPASTRLISSARAEGLARIGYGCF